MLNYILGQYEIKYKELKNKLLSNIGNTLLLLIASNIIYITINLITDDINFKVVDFFLFNKTTYKIFLYILISQSLIDVVLHQKYLNL